MSFEKLLVGKFYLCVCWKKQTNTDILFLWKVLLEISIYWHVVQQVEHQTVNLGVGSSKLSMPAKLNSTECGGIQSCDDVFLYMTD